MEGLDPTPLEWLNEAAELHKIVTSKLSKAEDDQGSEISAISSLLDIRSQKVGWLKWGFLFSYYFLMRYEALGDELIYKTAIRLSIQQGGDTDTNAAIVGGMIGALTGANKLPEYMVNKVLRYNHKDFGGRNRPDFITPKTHLMKQIALLISNRPTDKLQILRNNAVVYSSKALEVVKKLK